jgi:hypothetical protein
MILYHLATGDYLAVIGALDKKRFRFSVRFRDDKPSLVKWTEWSPDNVTADTISSLMEDAKFVIVSI